MTQSEELFDKTNDNQIRQNGLVMNTDEVVDLLNSQSKLISAYQYEFVKMRKENEQLKELATRTEEEKEHYANLYNECRKKLECCEYEHFLNELEEIHEKIDKGDLFDFNPLKEDKPLNDYNPLKEHIG